MTSPTAEDFARHFTAAFTAQDLDALASLLAEDAQVMSLSGLWADGRATACDGLAGEFAGLLATARLVTGKSQLRAIGPGAAVLHQRYVVTGAQFAPGEEMPRFPAMLTAVLLAKPDGWQAVSLAIAAISD